MVSQYDRADLYNDFFEGRNSYFYGRHSRTRDYRQNKELLSPLFEVLEKYDSTRLRLEQHGGDISDLKYITHLLSSPIKVQGTCGTEEIKLNQQDTIKKALRCIDYDLHFDIRMLSSRMPAYYLCRLRNDYWGEYGIIVEDLYMSPGYPIIDQRFIKLMQRGHEVYYLRLSQFRNQLAPLVENNQHLTDQEIESLLYDLGRYIFLAAWHDDQRLGIMISQHLNLTHFEESVELLYLCLSGELCELRSSIRPIIIRFFESVYPRPHILHFLEILPNLDGKYLNDLPQTAMLLYKKLIKSFSKFLSVEFDWGPKNMPMPLWKIVYGNFYRIKTVTNEITRYETLNQAAKKLEEVADGVCRELLGTSKTNYDQI